MLFHPMFRETDWREPTSTLSGSSPPGPHLTKKASFPVGTGDFQGEAGAKVAFAFANALTPFLSRNDDFTSSICWCSPAKPESVLSGDAGEGEATRD